MDDLDEPRPDAAARFELSRVSGQRVNDADFLADLSSVANKLGATTVSMPQYKRHGQYDGRNLSRRFGSWNKALLAAGLTLSNEIDISDDRLFENILILWQHYGRQPRRSELSTSPSTISQSPYSRRFRSWMGALKAFIEYANATSVEAVAVPQITMATTPPDATHHYGFAGKCFSVTASPVAGAAEVRWY